MESVNDLTKIRLRPKPIGCALLALLFASLTFAQISSLQGTVKGWDGAPLWGALIKIDRMDAGGLYRTKTDKAGRFFYFGLPQGNYKVTCNVDEKDVDSVNNVSTKVSGSVSVNFDLRAIAKKSTRPRQPPSEGNSDIVHAGQTMDEVKGLLGPPDRIENTNGGVIWVYTGLRVTFANGKVANVQ
jgi:hypothetical protein